MHLSSRSILTLAFSLLLIFVVGLALFGPIRASMHASSTSLKPSAKPGMSTTNTSLTCGAWKVIFSPNVGWRNNTLEDVTADTNDVWAVGYHLGSKNTNATLTEHWNGTRWSVVPSPNVGSGSNVLVGVARVPGSTLIISQFR